MKDLNISIDLIKQLKQQIVASRYAVAKIANAESLRLYFTIGKLIDDETIKNAWGTKILNIISEKLQQELPGLRGFSGSKLKKMRLFYKAWCNSGKISSTTTNQTEIDNEYKGENNILNLLSISFSHHFKIIGTN